MLLDRKKEAHTIKTGDDYHYGTKIALDFPIELFVTKWSNRFQREADAREDFPPNAPVKDGRSPTNLNGASATTWDHNCIAVFEIDRDSLNQLLPDPRK